MNANEYKRLLSTIEDRKLATSERILALQGLVAADENKGFAEFLDLSTATDNDLSLNKAIGQMIATVMVKRQWLGAKEHDVLPFYGWSAETFDEYNETVVRLRGDELKTGNTKP